MNEEAKQKTAEDELERVREHIENWRKTRLKLGAMPAQLWDEAAAVARKLGAYRVAEVLRLNYRLLKDRAFPEQSGRVTKKRRQPSSAAKRGGFVEVNPLHSAATLAAASEALVIEVVAAGGARLIIRHKGVVGPELAALVASFR